MSHSKDALEIRMIADCRVAYSQVHNLYAQVNLIRSRYDEHELAVVADQKDLYDAGVKLELITAWVKHMKSLKDDHEA